jgi:hypothetical protein
MTGWTAISQDGAKTLISSEVSDRLKILEDAEQDSDSVIHVKGDAKTWEIVVNYYSLPEVDESPTTKWESLPRQVYLATHSVCDLWLCVNAITIYNLTDLYENACRHIADKIRGKSEDEMRELFSRDGVLCDGSYVPNRQTVNA